MKLDEVEPGTPLIRVRCVAPVNRDAIVIHVHRYTDCGDYVKSEKLSKNGKWEEYNPFEELEPFYEIAGQVWRKDWLQDEADRLCEMIMEKLAKENDGSEGESNE